MHGKTFAALSLAIAGVFTVPVAQASAVDLTAACGGSGNHGGTPPTAIFQNPCNVDTVGTGLVRPFLSIGGANENVVEGFNTDAAFTMDQQRATNFTGPLTVGQVGTFNIGGTLYRQFFLDINESNGGGEQYLSLDKLQIALGTAGDLATMPGPLIYDMGTGNNVLLNYDLFKGSGNGFDMTFFIKSDLFGTDDNAFIYLYAEFGATGTVSGKKFANSDGFEEFWALRAAGDPCITNPNLPGCGPPPTEVPEPATLLLAGVAMLGLAASRKRRRD